VREEGPYNPLDKLNLGVSVTSTMLEQTPIRLPRVESFVGAGIYAIYYVGPFALYDRIAKANRGKKFRWPIYVGKAVPAGARQGGFGLGANPGEVLFRRIRDHERSIDQATNLDVNDFYCRYLVVEDIWIPLGESLLIEELSPLWNRCLDGFGNHDPGRGRYSQQRSAWDVVHPGRDWANKCVANNRSLAEISTDVHAFLHEHKR
jgi:hypothetical protein